LVFVKFALSFVTLLDVGHASRHAAKNIAQ